MKSEAEQTSVEATQGKEQENPRVFIFRRFDGVLFRASDFNPWLLLGVTSLQLSPPPRVTNSMRSDNSMRDNASPNTFSLPPLPKSMPPKPGLWQRFLAFPVTRIVLYLAVFGVIAAGPSFALLGVLHFLHHPPGHDRVRIALLSEALYAPSPVLAFWVMVRFIDKRPWATAGFNQQGLIRGLLGGLALGAAMMTAGVLALLGLGLYHVAAVTPGAFLLPPLLLYFGVALSEETLFRGYVFQTLEGRWGSGVALAVTSLLFGLAHLGNPVPGASHWMRLAGPLQICFEAGLPLGAAYLLTRRWWLSIGIHWAWDYFEGPVYGCPDSGTHDPHTLIHATLSGPALLTGGPFGPEAGLGFLLVGTLAGVLLLRAAIKRGQWLPRPRRSV